MQRYVYITEECVERLSDLFGGRDALLRHDVYCFHTVLREELGSVFVRIGAGEVEILPGEWE